MIPPVIHHGGLHALVLCAPDSLKVRTLERELDNTKSSKHSDHSEPRGKRAQVTARGKKRKSAIVTVNRSEIEEKKVMVDLTGTITDEQIVPTFGLHDPRLPDAVYALQKSLSVPSTEPGEIVSMQGSQSSSLLHHLGQTLPSLNDPYPAPNSFKIRSSLPSLATLQQCSHRRSRNLMARPLSVSKNGLD
ncbi:MAG: hypothetical protein LQ341_002781 [Variospora aurantia]|nr:MAG: hypothetical protein LQ341_002781 [Variospora aurantia]